MQYEIKKGVGTILDSDPIIGYSYELTFEQRIKEVRDPCCWLGNKDSRCKELGMRANLSVWRIGMRPLFLKWNEWSREWWG